MSETHTLVAGIPAVPDELMDLPAIFASHFHVMGGPGVIRLTFAESVDSKKLFYRGAFFLQVATAKQLVALLSETIAQAEVAPSVGTTG